MLMLDLNFVYPEPRSKMSAQERICRFCYEECYGKFKAIEKTTQIILDTLLIKKNLAVSSEPVMCTDCAEILQKCFDFKTNCLRNSLKDQYLYKRTNESSNGTSDDQVVCGLCMGLLNNCSFAILNIKEDDMKEKIMLEKCLPELELITTEKLVVCVACIESLQSYFNFLSNSKIENYREAASINHKDLIISSNIRHFALGNICEDEGNRINVIKTEDTIRSDLQLTSENITEDNDKINFVKIENTVTWKESVQEVRQEEETGSDLTDVKVKEEIFSLCDIGETDTKRDQHGIDSDAVLEQGQSGHIEPIFSCGVCPFKSSAKDRVLVHIDNKHKNEATKRGLPPAAYITLENGPDDTLYKCLDCLYTTKIKSRLTKHLLSHQASQDGVTLSDAMLEQRQSWYLKPKMFACRLCPFQSSARYRLMVHTVNTHKNEATKRGLPPAVCITLGNAPYDILFKCVDCPYTTKLKSRFTKHLLSHQPPQDTDAPRMVHKCPHCDYQAKVHVNLRQHIRNVHEPGQLKHCERCSFQMEWTDQQVLRLIDAYKIHKLLWDRRHPKHLHKICKKDAWKEIAMRIDVCADECRKKMVSLLASLRKEKSRMRKSLVTASGADDVYKSRWFAFKPLQFLLNKAKSRKGTTLQNEKKMNNTKDTEATATVESQSVPTSIRKTSKRKVEENRLDEAFSISQASASNTHDEDDKIQTFCHLVANKLKTYSPVTCIAVQQQIMNILFNADRGFYDGLPYPIQPEFSTQYNYPQFTHSQYYSYSNTSTPSAARNNYPRPHTQPASSASEDVTFDDLI